jgi:hypothetical protein
MRTFITGIVLFVSIVTAGAEGGAWNFKGMIGATYNSTNVSDNWSGTEKNSESWGAKLDLAAEQDTALANWTTTLKEEYGRTKVAGVEDQVSADLIDFMSVYTHKLNVYVNPYVSLAVNTQNWRLLDPVTYTESVGNGVWLLDRPRQQLKTRAGLAFRQTFDMAQEVIDPATGLTRRVSSADDPATLAVEDSLY